MSGKRDEMEDDVGWWASWNVGRKKEEEWGQAKDSISNQVTDKLQKAGNWERRPIFALFNNGRCAPETGSQLSTERQSIAGTSWNREISCYPGLIYKNTKGRTTVGTKGTRKLLFALRFVNEQASS